MKKNEFALSGMNPYSEVFKTSNDEMVKISEIYNDGLKEGKAQEQERILKIIDEMEDLGYNTIHRISLKLAIKGDEQ